MIEGHTNASRDVRYSAAFQTVDTADHTENLTGHAYCTTQMAETL